MAPALRRVLTEPGARRRDVGRRRPGSPPSCSGRRSPARYRALRRRARGEPHAVRPCMTHARRRPFDHIAAAQRRHRPVRARRGIDRRGASTATASTTWPAASWSSSREPDPRPSVAALAERYLAFLAARRRPPTVVPQPAGLRPAAGRTTRDSSDCWGRGAVGPGHRRRPATGATIRAARRWPASTAARSRRSAWPRAMAFAALGAAEVLAVSPGHTAARRRLLADAAATDRHARPASPHWPWPEPRLTYANAALAEALIAAGRAPGRPVALDGRPALLELAARRRDPRRPPVGDPGRRLGARRAPRPASTSSRSRSPRWPMRAPARCELTGDPRWAPGSSWPSAGSSATTTPGRRCTTRDSGGGCDGLHAGRAQRQPGRRVDPGPDLDAAARAPARATVVSDGHSSRSSVRSRARPPAAPGPPAGHRRLFVPGQEMLIDGESRAAAVIDRILALLDDDEVAATLGRRRRAGSPAATATSRHILAEHFALVAHRIDAGGDLSADSAGCSSAPTSPTSTPSRRPRCATRRSCAHPDQDGLAAGELRVRDEPARSRRGPPVLDRVPHRRARRRGDAAPRRARRSPRHRAPSSRRAPTASCSTRELAELGDDGESAALRPRPLPDPFTGDELERRAARAPRSARSPGEAPARPSSSSARSRRRNYEVELPRRRPRSPSACSGPTAPTESHGMEDARFVRFVDDDGDRRPTTPPTPPTTARTSRRSCSRPTDFRTFAMSPSSPGRPPQTRAWRCSPGGSAAASSRCPAGTARPSRSPPPTTCRSGATPTPLHAPDAALGAHPARQLRLAHRDRRRLAGAHPRRRADADATPSAPMLLDLDDPTRSSATCPSRCSSPTEDERDGYVPNVVYSCGAVLHGDTLVIPYGIADANIGVATIPLEQVLDRVSDRPRRRGRASYTSAIVGGQDEPAGLRGGAGRRRRPSVRGWSGRAARAPRLGQVGHQPLARPPAYRSASAAGSSSHVAVTTKWASTSSVSSRACPVEVALLEEGVELATEPVEAEAVANWKA